MEIIDISAPIDYLSVGDEEAHVVLLWAGVVPLEGLDLRGVEPGDYRLLCLPLRILSSDGAPPQPSSSLRRLRRTVAFRH